MSKDIHILIEPEVHHAFKNKATNSGTTMSYLFRTWINKYLTES